MSIDIKVLIEQVRERQPLWHRQHSGYFNKKLVTKLWAEIAAAQGVDQAAVKAKWKGLRDTFRLEMKKGTESSWTFYRNMMFLKSHIKTRPKVDEEDYEEEDYGSVKEEPMEESPLANCVYLTEYPDPVRPQRQEDQEPGNPALFYRTGTVPAFEDRSLDGDPEKDDDYHFLMSFLPEMKKLDTRKKMLLRIKMMELFYKETYDPSYKD